MKVEKNIWQSAQKNLFGKQYEAWENAKIEVGYKRCSDSDFTTYLLSLNIE